MFRTLTLLLSLIFTVALSTAAVAQTPTAEDPSEALNEISADPTIYSRSFETDMTASPDVDAEMPVTAILQVYELEDADVAEEAFPYVEQLMKNELEPIVDTTFETEDIDDLGDMATISSAELEEGGIPVGVTLVLVQQDNVIYLTAVVVMNSDSDAFATDLMAFMLDGEPGDAADVEENEAGTSTGGYFDVFPTDEDTDLLQGLQATEDMYQSSN